MENPFAETANRAIRPPATAMIIFGATGDLTHRKLIPALYHLAHQDLLPSEFVLMGVSRSGLSDQDFRDRVRVSIEKYADEPFDEKLWNHFSKSIYFQPADVSNTEQMQALKERIQEVCSHSVEQLNILFYLATAPRHYEAIAQNLNSAGMSGSCEPGEQQTRIVVEKPFGRDLESARELNAVFLKNFAESQIYRIDHYLGKETVQNILVFRFANGIFEPLWNHKYVDHIQISVCESVGVSGRGGYFDNTGILRDIVQNHLLQMLSLICIEPPNSLSDADSIRDEKVKVLRSIRRLSAGEVSKNCVRAQYLSGFMEGEKVVGYREEEGVDPQSQAETFVALKMEIDNWRWAGVPIYIRAGKRLPKRITEISIVFKQPPRSLFRGRQVPDIEPNVLAIQVQPNEGISLKIGSKPPGMRMRVRPVVMDFHYGHSFGTRSPEAYERLLLDVMKGDATLFTRNDEIEQAWDVVEPILQSWQGERSANMFEYKSGNWGPKAAADLLRPAGHTWREL
jgi:glucose-6-phosphate 1-dehydrogenase